MLPKEMGYAVRLNSVETFEIQQRNRVAAACRVPLAHRTDVHPCRLGDTRVPREDVIEHIAHGNGWQSFTAEFRRQMECQGVLEALVIEHDRVQDV